ncbi:MAG: sugar transferase [Clostridia bacterium]|nr:sugar transferase [Clostridia bacterium]
MLKPFEQLDKPFQNQRVREYYDLLCTKKASLFVKRIFDIVVSLILIVLLSPVLIALSLWIAADSKGGVMFRQTRVTSYGKEFKIFKFRTMVKDAASLGASVTVGDDPRITRVGKKIRKYRLDEIPQLFNVLLGDMSFVGTRPEVPKYVERYTEEMYATLLMPAGLTSLASIMFKDEDKLLNGSENPDEVYVNEVLPKKMAYNLEYIKNFSFWKDIALCFKTIKEVF